MSHSQKSGKVAVMSSKPVPRRFHRLRKNRAKSRFLVFFTIALFPALRLKHLLSEDQPGVNKETSEATRLNHSSNVPGSTNHVAALLLSACGMLS